MRLRVGILIGYLLIALLAAYFVLNVFVDEIKPSARQSMEDSLVDTANLLAELAVDDVKRGEWDKGSFAHRVAAYQARDFRASIWGFPRERPGFRIYITDAQGVVRYDSSGESLGQDFSQWNDVYLTLQGKYGVRSSPDVRGVGAEIKDGKTGMTTMYVAAPIKDGGKIIGVLTVAKSNSAIEPFIERTKSKITQAGYWLIFVSVLIGLIMSYWLSASVSKLVAYAEAVARGERVLLPALSIKEMRILGSSLQSMRERLEGKRYVEEYVWTLTHEMKSPLTAIQASSELLQEPMPDAQRQTFLRSIVDQTKRLHLLIEKMLQQASLEYRQSLEKVETLEIAELVDRSLASLRPKSSKRNLEWKLSLRDAVEISGERFLIEQAFVNVLENALEFSPEHGLITIELEELDRAWCLKVSDQGPGIPDYAQKKIFDRFYSLPRPGTGAKSTGLGLSFVKQVMDLHKGRVEISNIPQGGAVARLFFPKIV